MMERVGSERDCEKAKKRNADHRRQPARTPKNKLTLSLGPFSLRTRWTTMPASALFTKWAEPEMSYRLGASPFHCCSCFGWATNQTWTSLCWANRLILVSIWDTYSVSDMEEWRWWSSSLYGSMTRPRMPYLFLFLFF
jgi:hypothetical protein